MTKILDRITQIARVCHAANAEYCRSIGDNSQPEWDMAPSWQQDSARMGVQAIIDNPDQTPKMSHDSWRAQKVAEGWKWGPKKDPEKKEHHCMVDYSELPIEQRVKDYIFLGVVKAMLAASGE